MINALRLNGQDVAVAEMLNCLPHPYARAVNKLSLLDLGSGNSKSLITRNNSLLFLATGGRWRGLSGANCALSRVNNGKRELNL